ncbi:MAG: RelA/SpoT family protein [Bacteroidetes bacterium]|nr:MAG: RelA/SpoT family protein [Bacteroidota bacterium]PIE87744.1 MAG: RelA/SpoT family protein [Bacteroidota bacterium]
MYQINEELEKREILIRYRHLLRAWKSDNKKEHYPIIRKAFEFAVEAHKGVRRKSGEPYIYHPLEVARICAAEIGLGKTSIVCALLHDVVEDTDYTLEDIKEHFGEKVAEIIDGLTKIASINMDKNNASIQAENFKKMILTLSADVRVILIKLADRTHNMRTLDSMPLHKQLKIASETLFLYAPLAHRLGLYLIKSELEDLSLKYTEPEIYETITRKLQESEQDRKRLIMKFIYPIKKDLALQSFDYEIKARTKSIFSIWKKMKKKDIPFEEVYDLFAIRIVVNTDLKWEKADCWKVYSIVTDHYSPKQDRLRDWISTPKANGYESLHTTVMSNEGQWVEVQIRTERMNEIAERGYAAHWKYKGETGQESSLDKWLYRIQDLINSSDSDALSFLDDFKMNLFADEIFVFTPKGDLRTLPAQSTVLDFAYSIHSQLGNSCIAAKVNHKLASIDHILSSGDQVEIIISKKQKPSEEWLNMVNTARAKNGIKEAIKAEKKKYYSIGDKELHSIFSTLKIAYRNEYIDFLLKEFDLHTKSDLFYRVALGKINAANIQKAFKIQKKHKSGFKRLLWWTREKDNSSTLSQMIQDQTKENPETLVLEDNIEDIKYNISKCCNPIPGDDVVGFITHKNVIRIHRTNCNEAIKQMSRHGNRIVKAKWRSHDEIGFLTGIRFDGMDKKGLLNEITNIIVKKHDINIRSINVKSHQGITDGEIILYINDTQKLYELMEHLRAIPQLEHVTRINRNVE